MGLKFEVVGKKMKLEKCKKQFRVEDKEFKKNKELFTEELKSYFPESEVSEEEDDKSDDDEKEAENEEEDQDNEDEKIPEEEDENDDEEDEEEETGKKNSQIDEEF